MHLDSWLLWGCCATRHSTEIDFAHRTGFVRLALKHGVQIVPVVSIGGQETALFLGEVRFFARPRGISRCKSALGRTAGELRQLC